MVESKPWNWDVVSDERWNNPSEDVYYYVHRWKELGYRDLLDLGCGLGRNSILFSQNGFNVYAFDLSQTAIAKLEENSEKLGLGIHTKLGDMLNLPYQDSSFDCILAYHVISHTDTEGMKKIIREIGRVLRKNGEFYFTLCSKEGFRDPIKGQMIDANTVVKLEEPERGIPHFHADLEDIKDLFSGFKFEKIRHIQDIFENMSSYHYFVLVKNV